MIFLKIAILALFWIVYTRRQRKMKKNGIITIVAIIVVAVIGVVLGFVVWSGKEATLSFIVDDEVYHTIKTKGKESITLPDDPTKDGYTFDGWFIDDECKNAFEFDVMPASNTTIYAKWNPEQN
jgi:uncharacterized repeat protein (TIGR02543 family)